MNPDQALSRRDFVKRLRAAAVATGLAAPGLNAASYGQVTGANDRIVLGNQYVLLVAPSLVFRTLTDW